MGFSLKPFKNILDTVAGVPVAAVKTIGNVGSLAIGDLMGNNQERINADTALHNTLNTVMTNPAAVNGNLGPDMGHLGADALHTGVGIASGIAQPIVAGAMDFGQFFGNLGTTAAGGQAQTGGQFWGDNPVTRWAGGGNPNNIGTLHNAFANAGQIALDAATAGGGKLLEGAVTPVVEHGIGSVVGDRAASIIAPRVVDSAIGVPIGAAYNATNAAGNNETPQQIIEAAAGGAKAGGALGFLTGSRTETDIPDDGRVVAETPPADVVPVPKTQAELNDQIANLQQANLSGKLNNEDFSQQYKQLQSSYKPLDDLSTEPTAQPNAIHDIAVQDGVSENTAQALQHAADLLTKPFDNYEGRNADQIIGQKNGLEANGRVASNDLEQAVRNELGNNKQLLDDYGDVMDGHKLDHPIDPRVASLVRATRALHDLDFKFHERINGAKYTENYLSRFKAGGRAAVTSAKGKISVAKDKLGLSTYSRHDESRVIHKFVSEDGRAVFGSATDNGLRQVGKGENHFVDKDGNDFKVVKTSSRELEDNGMGKYLHNGARITNLYHTNTTKIVARQRAINDLVSGGHVEFVGEADAPKGMVKIEGVPELDGYVAPKRLAGLAKQQLGGDHSGLIGTAWDKVTTGIVHTIVANPIFHGLNQYVQSMIEAGRVPLFKGGKMQSGVVGMTRFNARMIGFALDPKSLAMATERARAAGLHIPEYGAFQHGAFYNVFNKVHVGGLTKVPGRSMYELERLFRVTSYYEALDKGISRGDAIRSIEHYLGDAHSMGKVANRTFMFAHYAKTMGGSLIGLARLDKQYGAAANFIALWAVSQALNAGWQEMTGNKHASIRAPGMIGFGESAIKAPGQIAHGQVPSVVRSHLNPLASFSIQEATNRDLSRPVSGAAGVDNQLRGPNGEGSGQLAIKTLLGPGYTVSSMNSGKESAGEAALGYGVGAYTPHVKGYQAAPNEPWLNTKDAQAGTGDNVRQVFAARDAEATKLYNQQDQKTFEAFKTYFAHNYTPDGKTLLLTPGQSYSQWASLAQNGKLLEAIASAEINGDKNHNPEWDLLHKGDGVVKSYDDKGNLQTSSAPKLAIYAYYKSLPPGELDKAAIAQWNPWIKDTENAAAIWNQQNITKGNAVEPPGYVPFPAVNPAAQTKMDQMDQLLAIPSADRTPDQIKQVSALFSDPDVTAAFHDRTVYDNAVRASMHAAPIAQDPSQDPKVEAGWKAFDALPSGKGIHARSDWIKANPGIWNQMSQQAEAQALYGVEKYGGQAYYGANVPDSFVGDLYNLGQHDISKVKNLNGTTSYSLTDFTGKGGTGANGLPYADLATAKANGLGGSGSGSSSTTGYGPNDKYLPNGLRNPHYVNKFGYASALNPGKFSKNAYNSKPKVPRVKIRAGGSDNYMKTIKLKNNPKRLKVSGTTTKIESKGKK